MKYLLLICRDESVELSASEKAEMPAATQAWVTEMDGSGVRLLGNRLQPVSDATAVRVRDAEVLLADGPFAETKEQIAGFDIVECTDLDHAIQVAAKHPVARFGTIEVRPFWPQ
ncbi:MAG TPA: YciI family protein [Streptosporangiaceae bacterium]